MFQYVYDFGDDWDYSICIEWVSEVSLGVIYLRFLKVSGVCLFEDVGGVLGYEVFFEVFVDLDYEQYDDMVSWLGVFFDFKDVRIDRIVECFD